MTAKRRCSNVLTFLDYQLAPGKTNLDFSPDLIFAAYSVLIDSADEISFYQCPDEFLDWSKYQVEGEIQVRQSDEKHKFMVQSIIGKFKNQIEAEFNFQNYNTTKARNF